ncbi:hypothetical protein SCACP_31870 [Sporomusa carbonis]|uniref:DUF4143 domain-containing protein n=1 Tax=Sporomusa carbonis TaxID=3076075 RepID=UPI003A66E8C9
MSGAFFETWVAGEIVKSYCNAGKRPPLYYYRDKDQREIDLIVSGNNTSFPNRNKEKRKPGKGCCKTLWNLAKIRA